ncbi:MAG: DUF2934 domain-containing protein [Nitrospirae bacterium]|nr:DUF2934 domain-containing protein [Nitrospirota bacterium]
MRRSAAYITIRTYESYMERGCREGCALENWLEAEKETVSRAFST